MSKLITASLIGAIDWINVCPDSWKEKALNDLNNQLGRVWSNERSPQQDRGIRFESTVYAYAAPTRTSQKGSEHFRWFVEQCKGGIFQKKMKRFIKIDDVEYCLYGKADVWFPSVIKDIKTTDNWKGFEKYLNGFQHKLYCFMEGIKNFAYLVGEFLPESDEMVNHYNIEYEVIDEATLQEEVIERIRKAIQFIRSDPQRSLLYDTKFSLY